MATRKALEGNQHMRLGDGTDASTATPRRGSPLCRSTLKTAATAAAGVMLAAVADAVDLPWVYDTSGRSVVETKSVGTANHLGTFATMAGHWSYPSTTSRLQTTPWKGIMIIVK